MRDFRFSSGAASPVRHGAGNGDLVSQARHFTEGALRQLAALMEKSEDEKLRMACAKYLLEAAWGKPAPVKLDPAAEAVPTEMIDRIYAMIDASRAASRQLAIGQRG